MIKLELGKKMETKETNTEKQWCIKLVNTEIDDLKNELPLNEDTFKVLVNGAKTDFEVKSNEDFYNYICQCAYEYLQIETLKNDGKIKKFNEDDIIEVLSKYNIIKMKITKVKNKIISKSYWVKDYEDLNKMYIEANLRELCEILYETLNMSNFNKVVSNVLSRLNDMSPYKKKFKLLNEAPSHIILTRNGVFNSLTREFTTDLSLYENFDFINKLDYRILTPNQVNQGYYEINKRIFNDWCENNDEKVLYLKQICSAVIDGNGRDTYHIIVANGGNGKSTYLYLLEKLASEYFIHLNMDEITDDNKLVDLKESTKITIGHELSTRVKFSESAIARLKLFITGDSFKVNVKYDKARDIKNSGVKIQATNTLPKFFENSDALKRRLKIFNWTDVNYSQLNDKLDLYTLLDKHEFIEASLAWIFTDNDSFTEFIKIEDLTLATNEALNDADQVYQFLDWSKDLGLMVGKITTAYFYQIYLYWNKYENGYIKPLKRREFTERLRKLENNFNFSIVMKQTRLSSLKNYECNPKLINELYFNNELKYNLYQLSTYIIFNEQIDQHDLNVFDEKLEQNEVEDINDYRDWLILETLINEMNPDAMTFKQYIIEKQSN